MKIICIGRNYYDHVRELNNSIPKEPIFFLKPDTALIPNQLPFFIPEFSNNIHYELEIVLRVCKVGKHISKKFAHKYYDAIGLGIDFTARDIQDLCRKEGLPWEPAKAFDFSAPVSNFFSLSEFENIYTLPFRLELNNNTVQDGNTKDMIFSFEDIIAHISKYITLKTGDLIFTGTPAGVGKVNTDDILKGYLNDKNVLTVKVK
jgi:acylpyruvate hydrolase